MKPTRINTSLRCIELKYKNENPLSEFEERLLEKYVALHKQTAAVMQQYGKLQQTIQAFPPLLSSLQEKLERLKNMSANLILKTEKHNALPEAERIKKQISLLQEGKVLNAEIQSFHTGINEVQMLLKKNDEEKKRVEALYLELNAEPEEGGEKSAYEKMNEEISLLFSNYKQYAIDISEFDDDWQKYLGKLDEISRLDKNCSRLRNDYVKEWNLFLEEVQRFFDSLQEQNEPDEEQKPIATGTPKHKEDVNEHYRELAERFENDLKYNTRTFYDADDWGLIIDNYLYFADNEKARLALERASEQHPNHPDFMIRQANEEIHRQSYQKAQALLAEAEKISPGHPGLFFAKGNLYRDMQMQEQAIACFKKTIELSSQDTGGLRRMAYANLAHIYRDQKKYDEGILLLNECVQRKHHDDKIIIDLAYLYESAGRIKEAVPLLENFLKKNPRFIECWNTLGNIYGSLGEHEKALETFDYILEKKPDEIPVLLNKGETLRALKRYTEAIACYQKAISWGENTHILNFLTGECYYGMEKYDYAENYYRLALDAVPEFEPARQRLKELGKRGK